MYRKEPNLIKKNDLEIIIHFKILKKIFSSGDIYNAYLFSTSKEKYVKSTAPKQEHTNFFEYRHLRGAHVSSLSEPFCSSLR